MRRLGGAAAAAMTVMVLLAGCGSQTTPSTRTPTVTIAPSTAPAPPSASRSASATTAPTTPPTRSASPPRPTAAPSAASSGNDSAAPADQCPDDSLGVSITTADGGGGAGSEYFDVLLTNTGGVTCVLRGTPGVSVVGGAGGTQIGLPADRDQTDVRSLRLAVGETVAAPLKVVDIGTDGGPLDGCRVERGAGYRVYPPHSERAFFVQDADAVACAGGPVFMSVSPVVRLTD